MSVERCSIILKPWGVFSFSILTKQNKKRLGKITKLVKRLKGVHISVLDLIIDLTFQNLESNPGEMKGVFVFLSPSLFVAQGMFLFFNVVDFMYSEIQFNNSLSWTCEFLKIKTHDGKQNMEGFTVKLITWDRHSFLSYWTLLKH